MDRNAPGFATRSVNARLAAGLRAAEGWMLATGIHDAEIIDFLEHWWQWPMVTEETFNSWYAYDNDLLGAALGGELPERS